MMSYAGEEECFKRSIEPAEWTCCSKSDATNLGQPA